MSFNYKLLFKVVLAILGPLHFMLILESGCQFLKKKKKAFLDFDWESFEDIDQYMNIVYFSTFYSSLISLCNVL